MAKYNRQILVPYLRDVCSMEMLCAKLSRENAKCRENIATLDKQVNLKVIDPAKPLRSDFEKEGDASSAIAVGIWTALFIGVGGWLLQWVPWLSIIPFGIAGIIIWVISKDAEADNEQEEKEFNSAMRRYEYKIKQNQQYREAIPQYRRTLNDEKQRLVKLDRQLAEAKVLRQKVYDVNIIPARYRNIHVAYYLYDYFDSYRENDLDKIIQTMLLDEIIQKMDRIISQNEEIILNQRVQMAMDEERDYRLAEHQRQELKAFARMERNQELQMDYQNMIARNQEVTNFFLAADYFRKSK